jgi:hypothetical protein
MLLLIENRSITSSDRVEDRVDEETLSEIVVNLWGSTRDVKRPVFLVVRRGDASEQTVRHVYGPRPRRRAEWAA